MWQPAPLSYWTFKPAIGQEHGTPSSVTGNTQCLAQWFPQSSSISKLFIAQRHHRIDARRPPRRDVTRHYCNNRQPCHHSEERQRIRRFHTKKLALYDAGEPQRPEQSEADTHQRNPHTFFQNESQYIRFGGADSHSYTNFMRALHHTVRHHAEEADNRK